MAKYSEIFSEYDITKWGVKFASDDVATVMDTLGNASESMNVTTVTKKKRNQDWKTRTKATGSGEVTVQCHIRTDVYAKMFGMYVDGYKEGVMVYGNLSRHEQFCMTELVEDEDGVQKLKAYPCCTLKEGISRSVDTNAEEVAEIELTISVDPDEDGNGMYEMVCDTEDAKALIDTWISAFDTSLVKASTVVSTVSED